MATIFDSSRPRHRTDGRFFLVMACIMATIIVAGFSVNMAMGRSTFAVPLVYHLHAAVFFGWVVLFLVQNWSIAANNVRLHITLGLLAYIWAPVMVVMGFAIMITSLRRNGGPFFFDQNEFLISNAMLLVLFGALVIIAMLRRRYTGWHRRLMLVAMAILTAPGLGRLLPAPLMIPNAWRATIACTVVFPVIGMIADLRRFGRVHPAYFWGAGAIVAVQIVADLVAYSTWGVSITQALLAGTAGAARPMHAFIPPGMAL